MAEIEMPRKLWEHPSPEKTDMYRLMQTINREHNLKLKGFWDLYAYSITQRAQFWSDLFDFSPIIHTGTYKQSVDGSARIDVVPKWFQGVSINFAENILYSRQPGSPPSSHSTTNKEDDKIAAVEVKEGGKDTKEYTWATLRREAGVLASAMQERGVKQGDRVMAIAGNGFTTLLVFLAVTWVGGVFSSSSTDMGVQGVLQRAVQISPKYVFMDDAAVWNEKTHDLRDKMQQVVHGLKDTVEFENLIVIPRFAVPVDIKSIPKAEAWSSFLAFASKDGPPPFVQLPFHAPYLIAYSSGTTGNPKCIVHSVGAQVLTAFKESWLHAEVGPRATMFQFTSTSWIMYSALVIALIPGAKILLYDGSPFKPDLETFIRITAAHKVTNLGISPRWMYEIRKAGVVPREVADLSHLRIVVSTGMVLSEQLFEWFYDVGFPAHVHLSNASGGTDIAGFFVGMNPLTPVYLGGCQGPSLGVDLAVYDTSSPSGVAVPAGSSGELVVRNPFPNVPIHFYNDANNTKFRSSYFSKYPHAWAQGDFISIHPITRSIHLYGRADGVLNPSGIRFGSAEIYGVIERHFADKVIDSICVGQRRKGDMDESVFLFVLLRDGVKLDRGLIERIKKRIAEDLSKRHVPRWVFETPEIPTTVTGKKVELPVKQIISGQIITPSGTLVNPKSLDYFYQFAKIEDIIRRSKL